MNKLKVGTRGSHLAITQTKQALAYLQSQQPDLEFEIVEIVTKGDRLKNRSLQSIGGQGAFVKEIEHRLLNKTIDFAIHSLKDVPTLLPAELTIGGVLERQNPLDCLVFNNPKYCLENLPQGAVVGTSSLRRQAQLLQARPDLTIRPIRGNIDTRLRKLREDGYDAIVLAIAGLNRLGLTNENLFFEELSEARCLPAIGQGALAIECRKDDQELLDILDHATHQETYQAVLAEREFLRNMDGSCTFPIGGFASFDNNQLFLTGMVSRSDGSYMLKVTLTDENPIVLGKKVAEALLEQGAAVLIEECKAHDKETAVH